MKTQPSMDDFVATDIQVRARFDSTPVTLEDAVTLFGLLKAVIEAVELEITDQTGEEVQILPVLSVRGGSIEGEIKIKVNSESNSAELKSKLRAIVLGAFMALTPGESAVMATAPDPATAVSQPAPALSAQCQVDIAAAAAHAEDTWKYFGRGFSAEFYATSGGTTIKSRIEVPAVPKIAKRP
jgi:hypothetical protein